MVCCTYNCSDCSNISTCENNSSEPCNCDDPTGIIFAFFVPLLLEVVLICVIIGLVIWKRIKVAEFLYNLQLPKFRELPQWLLQKILRRSRSSSPQPEVYVERTVQNPTYDIEEGNPSDSTAKAEEAGAATELYEEIPTENGMDNLGEGFDVYDIPECPSNDQLEAYATTEVFGGGMLDPYAITDVSQKEGQLGAYAVTDVPVGDLSNERSRLVNAEVHVDSKTNPSSTGKPATLQKNTSVQRDKANSRVAVMPPVSKQPLSQSNTATNKERAKGKAPVATPAKQANAQKESADKVKGRNASSAKPGASLRSLDKVVSGAVGGSDPYKVKNIRVKFEDEDRRRSKSYTGVGWEAGAREEASSKPSSTGSSVRGKPKPLPKKRGILGRKIRERGASESGVDEYSKLDLKSQYAALEPHRGKEMSSEEFRESKMAQDSYSHLKY